MHICRAKNGAKVDHGIEARAETEVVRTPERRLRVGMNDVRLDASSAAASKLGGG